MDKKIEGAKRESDKTGQKWKWEEKRGVTRSGS